MEKYAQQADEALAHYHDYHVGGDGKFPTDAQLARLERIADEIIEEHGGMPADLPPVPCVKRSEGPGPGAVEYARQFIPEDATREEALEIIRRLLAEDHDPRVKRCAHCEFPYRDRTKNNGSKTCSRECKIDRDTYQEAVGNREARQATPRDYGQPEGYRFWDEYPSWDDEKKRDNYWARNEVPSEADKIDRISGKQQILGRGNRKTPIRKPGWEDDQARKALYRRK